MTTPNPSLPRIALTVGEPAGIGPDVVLALAEHPWRAEVVVIGDADLLRERAAQLGRVIGIARYDRASPPRAAHAGRLLVDHLSLPAPVRAGILDPANAPGVITTLARACDGALGGEFDAIVTAPVHKGVINDAGIPFSGHTEYFAERTGARLPVMLLVAGDLRVALVTTHLPLRDVPDAITSARLQQTTEILDAALRDAFGMTQPRIAVLGLNPHAGESGHLGHEDDEIIAPVIDRLRERGLHLTGPLPADTAFAPHQLAKTDAVLAMYHDQGLPVLKHRGFGRAVNVTLGLPITRTSVDHGTALDLAGTGRADTGSLRAAVELAIALHGHACR